MINSVPMSIGNRQGGLDRRSKQAARERDTAMMAIPIGKALTGLGLASIMLLGGAGAAAPACSAISAPGT